MSRFLNLFRVALLCVVIVAAPVWGAVEKEISHALKLHETPDLMRKNNVFVYGDESLDVLIPVRLLGAVTNGGVHYVPPDTDLVTLMTLAGGTQAKASLDRVTIKRRVEGKLQVIKVNLEELVEDPEQESPKLISDDIVLVPLEKKAISDNLLATVGLISGLATIFGTVVLGVVNLKK